MSAGDSFEEGCRNAFAYLVRRFGFDAPLTERLAQETFVRFHKDLLTVSIAFEPGLAPIVELFYPAADSGEPSVPWAERHGVARAYRIPRLRIAEAFLQDDPQSLRRYLGASARELERVEYDWLSGRLDPDQAPPRAD